VRFLPSKSKGVETAILLGSGVTAGKPCLERVLPLCFFSFFTFWVTSWKSAGEALTSPPLCFTTGFPGSPKGSLPQHLFSTSNAVHRSGLMKVVGTHRRVGSSVRFGTRKKKTTERAPYVARGRSRTRRAQQVFQSSAQRGQYMRSLGRR